MKKSFSIIVFLLSFSTILFAQYNKGIKVEPLLKSDTTSIGQKIVYPTFTSDEVTIAKITIPPGVSTGWHKHNFPVFAYVLQGTLTVDNEKHGTFTFPANSTFAEVVDIYHNGTNLGQKDVVLIAFYMGGKGQPLSIHK